MASMSKRAQARTEKELQDLLKVPGNSTCADCGARNPAWASWNLGIFLCMRCASIHRKLGTHISKVKSLSMDTWTNDQVDTMRRNGNLANNQTYNPKNKQPDMPLDVDEADGVMERFIRKKYQEKSLSDGRPEVPSRDEIPPPPRSRSPETPPPPIVPSKRSKFFGFGLRASSSAYPLSKHDKKHRSQAKDDNNFRVSSEDYTSTNRTSGSRAELSDYDLQLKLSQLHDMGFTDNERNTNALKRHNGDIERTIATLVKLGPSAPPTARRTTPTPTISTTSANMPQTSVSAPQSATTSNNPFEQSMQSSGFGLSYGNTAPHVTPISNNPWQTAVSSQANNSTGLEQAFSSIQVSQPSFQYNTGGYSSQPQYASQIVAPPVQNIPQQYSMNSSPVTMNNPFMQTPMSAHSTGSNPYGAHMQSVPNFAPSTNPFLSIQSSPNIQQTSSPSPIQMTNPFGLPPSNSPPQVRSQPIVHQPQSNIFDAQPGYTQNGSQTSSYPSIQNQQQHQNFTSAPQSPQGFPNFQYGQPQAQQYQQYQQQQSPTLNSQAQFNPYLQQSQQQSQQQQLPSPPPQHQPQQQPQQPLPIPQQPLMPQQTGGHLDKKSILALYNYPQLAPPKPLASIPEPTEEQSQTNSQPQQQFQQPQPHQQFTSPTPSGTVYGNGNNSTNGLNPGKRSVTMPASSMHSAGGTGSRNPFMNSANSSGSSTPATQNQQPFLPHGYAQGSRHASHDSMAVNNPTLQDGRHSPDAFASLSARYMR